MRMNQYKNIDEYICQFSKESQKILEEIRSTIHQAVPSATEAIKYGMPCFILYENSVYFGALSSHYGFYPTAAGIEKFKKEISKYNHSKGTVLFSSQVPYSLIAKIVKFRAKESVAKYKKQLEQKKAKKKVTSKSVQ